VLDGSNRLATIVSWLYRSIDKSPLVSIPSNVSVLGSVLIARTNVTFLNGLVTNTTIYFNLGWYILEKFQSSFFVALFSVLQVTRWVDLNSLSHCSLQMVIELVVSSSVLLSRTYFNLYVSSLGDST
jgi:hypothetical protein